MKLDKRRKPTSSNFQFEELPLPPQKTEEILVGVWKQTQERRHVFVISTVWNTDTNRIIAIRNIKIKKNDLNEKRGYTLNFGYRMEIKEAKLAKKKMALDVVEKTRRLSFSSRFLLHQDKTRSITRNRTHSSHRLKNKLDCCFFCLPFPIFHFFNSLSLSLFNFNFIISKFQ